jgi:hypothetical protein
MRAFFANTLVDIMDGALAPERVIHELGILTDAHRNEVTVAMLSDTLNPGSSWPNRASIDREHDIIRDFATRRPGYMLRAINSTLSRGGMRFAPENRYEVALTTGQGGGARMNLRPVGESEAAVGNYYANTSIKITALPNAGYAVDFWIVNGERINGDSVTIDAAAEVSLHFRARVL